MSELTRKNVFTSKHCPEHPRIRLWVHKKLSDDEGQEEFSRGSLGEKPTGQAGTGTHPKLSVKTFIGS